MIFKIPVKKYVRDYLTRVTNENDEPLYGPEPLYFSRKSRIGHAIESWRRIPRNEAEEKSEELSPNYVYLQVEVEPGKLPKDNKRTYLSKDAQNMISHEFLDIFYKGAFAYVMDHLLLQKRTLSHFKPSKQKAYSEFISEYDLDIDTDTVRRAFDREQKKLTKQISKKNAPV